MSIGNMPDRFKLAVDRTCVIVKWHYPCSIWLNEFANWPGAPSAVAAYPVAVFSSLYGDGRGPGGPRPVDPPGLGAGLMGIPGGAGRNIFATPGISQFESIAFHISNRPIGFRCWPIVGHMSRNVIIAWVNCIPICNCCCRLPSFMAGVVDAAQDGCAQLVIDVHKLLE